MPNKIVAAVCAVAAPLCPHKPSDPAGAKLYEARHAPVTRPVARNVILFVGEGMGVSTVTAAHILQGQIAAAADGPAARPDAAAQGEAGALSFERFPATALAKTYNTDLQTGESAGSMTALMTGHKTRGASVAVDKDQSPDVCVMAPPPKNSPPSPGAQPPVQGQLSTLFEQAKDAGLSVGLVTTGRLTQSAPAATYAHANNRDWEVDSQMSEAVRQAGCRDIARQLVEFDHHGGLDVALGGGRLAFLPSGVTQPGQGVRQDGRDLIDAWRRNPSHGRGLYVANAIQLGNANPKTDLPLLGLFAPDRLGLADPVTAATQGEAEPTLADMTEKALLALRGNRRGFVLVVDAAGIAAGHQAGNAQRALTETIELAKAVDLARLKSDPKTTLIIVTADQGSPLTIAGYPKRGAPILGLAPGQDAYGRPYTTLGYANGPGGLRQEREATAPPAPAESAISAAATTPVVDGRPLLVETSQWKLAPRPLLTESVAEDKDYVQLAAVPLRYGTHSGEVVPVYATGPGSAAIHGVIEQEDIYWAMVAAIPSVATRVKAAEATAAKASAAASKAASKGGKAGKSRGG